MALAVARRPLEGGTNQLMVNMYGTNECVLHTANEDGDGGEDDATTLPEYRVAGPNDGSSGSDDDGGQDNRGAASEDSDDEIMSTGTEAFQLLAIRANYRIRAINAYDWTSGRCIYRVHEDEVQEEGMVDLVPIGPSQILEAYGRLTLKIWTDNDDGSCKDPPLIVGWGVDVEEEVEEYILTISEGLSRNLEITYLVIPNAIETHVEVRLKLKDLSRAVYGRIKASAIDFGNNSVHLFSCERGSSLSFPSGSTSILPLTPSVIALPYRPRFKLHIEVDLRVITNGDRQEEDKNLKFCLDFTRRITSQEIQVDGDQVEVNVTWYLDRQI